MKKTDKGVSLLEVLLVIGIMVMVIPKVYENIENHLNNVRWQNAAEHANTYNTAVRNYVADNASTLLAGSLPKTITPATLIQKGYLKSGFLNPIWTKLHYRYCKEQQNIPSGSPDL